VHLTRRQFCEGTATLALASILAGSTALFAPEQALAQRLSDAELLKPSPLGDMVLGPANAPVTVIEYASMTCSHCAAFDTQTFPTLKSKYIDAGKVRFILREFPLDPLAAAAFMIARCAAGEDANKYYAMVDTLFHQQKTWAVQQPLAPLKTIARQAGLSEQAFNACLSNQQMLDKLEAVRKDAVDKLGVKSTPTFFINGEKREGALSVEEISKAIDQYLKAG
jgi:protein-disulfide isomerase